MRSRLLSVALMASKLSSSHREQSPARSVGEISVLRKRCMSRQLGTKPAVRCGAASRLVLKVERTDVELQRVGQERIATIEP
jgi:hypothetical protein